MAAGTPGSRRDEGLRLRGPVRPGFEGVLIPEALAFVADLTRRHAATLEALLEDRTRTQAHRHLSDPALPARRLGPVRGLGRSDRRDL